MKAFFALFLIAASVFAAAADSDDPDVNAVFDRNKGSVYAVYSRALRDNPKLSGKIVFNIDITAVPHGDVTSGPVQFPRPTMATDSTSPFGEGRIHSYGVPVV
jgi:hypothetical protein